MNTELIETMEDEKVAAFEHRHLEKIKALESEARRLENKMELEKAKYAKTKKEWEEAVAELRDCIRTGPDAQMELPFGDWRDTPIKDVITLTERQEEMFDAEGIKTVEQFESVRAGTHPTYKALTDLPRIGPAIAEKWENEIVDWIAENARDETESDEDDE